VTDPRNDIIKHAIALFCGSLSPEQRREIEIRLRTEFGGKSFYVRKADQRRPPVRQDDDHP
jgi:hypothetical protein